jgi:hypothetical protein
MTADEETLAELRRMWEQLDPPPSDLVDDMLVGLAAAELADEYAVLTLVADQRQLAGARGGSAPRTLEFALRRPGGDVALLLRIGELDDGAVRVDGWLAQEGSAGWLALEVDGAATGTVLLERDSGEDATAELTPGGRFEFARLHRGSARLTVAIGTGPAASDRLNLTTPAFEL